VRGVASDARLSNVSQLENSGYERVTGGPGLVESVVRLLRGLHGSELPGCVAKRARRESGLHGSAGRNGPGVRGCVEEVPERELRRPTDVSFQGLGLGCVEEREKGLQGLGLQISGLLKEFTRCSITCTLCLFVLRLAPSSASGARSTSCREARLFCSTWISPAPLGIGASKLSSESDSESDAN
jgi:hypothetical protein